MTIEELLVARLTGYPALAALVGNRVYPLVLPQNVALPAMTYQRISTLRVRSHSGPSGLAHPRFQFACWADSYAEAANVTRVLRLALDGFKLTPGGAALSENEIDDYEAETGRWRINADYIIWHSE